MERHALTFTVRPGTEQEARRILADYPRPDTQIDGDARLLGTSVFFWDNRVLRVMDVEGSLPLIMRHLSTQPAIRQTEAALNPLLTQRRDLDSPSGAREFFARAMMTRIVHLVADEDSLPPGGGPRTRVALRYPVRPGSGDKVAELLASEGSLLGSAATTALASASVFRHEDFVVLVADLVGDPDHIEEHLGRTVAGAPTTAGLSELLEPGWELTTPAGFQRFFAEQRLLLVTHRESDAVTS
jgi:SchA/CurD like domain